jgi:hypothetical protein
MVLKTEIALTENRADFRSRLKTIPVGIPLARYPPDGPGRALVSASGSYRGWLAAKRTAG